MGFYNINGRISLVFFSSRTIIFYYLHIWLLVAIVGGGVIFSGQTDGVFPWLKDWFRGYGKRGSVCTMGIWVRYMYGDAGAVLYSIQSTNTAHVLNEANGRRN